MTMPFLNATYQIAMKETAGALKQLGLGPDWFPFTWLAAATQTPWFWLAMASEGAAFAVWLRILQNVSLSLAFSLTSLGYITVLLSSWLVFHEHLGLVEIAGAALILAGVYVTTSAGDGEGAANKSAV
jgi:drug/metabolite transporter (DMT)-like permease